MPRTLHGEATFKNRTPEYETWLRIKQRCFYKKHKSYAHYGGRGISMWSPWRRSFKRFLKDVGRRPSSHHSINRVDNEIGYIPGNIHWATRIEQGRNRRSNRNLTMAGQTKTLAEWVEIFGIKRYVVAGRLKLGWPLRKALTAPVRTVRLITIKGITKSLIEWSRSNGISSPLILHRLKLGWTNAEAVLTPVRPCNRKQR